MSGTPAGAVVAVATAAVVLAALLSAGQAALLRLSRAALADVVAAQAHRGRSLARVAADPHGAAASAGRLRVVAETVAGVCVTTALLASQLRWWQAGLVAVVALAATALVLVRRVPREAARRHPQSTVRLTAGLLAAAAVAAAAGARLSRGGAAGDAHTEPTEDEIRDMVDRVSEAEHMQEDEREMVRSVLELGDTMVRAVMVPRTEMITLPSGTPGRKALSLFLRSGYSRVPVVGEVVDDVVGVLYLKDLLQRRHADPAADERPVDGLVRPALFVPESKPVDDLLRELQRGASHIALVVDEYGGIAGLVTIEDALEEIVGELTDEHDRSGPEVEDLGAGTYRVPARLPVDELGEIFDLELEDEDVDTAGGLLAKALGKVPLAGSSAEVYGLRLTADRIEGRRRRLSTLLVERLREPDDVTAQTVPADQGAHT